jgi:hypothetical protein
MSAVVFYLAYAKYEYLIYDKMGLFPLLKLDV